MRTNLHPPIRATKQSHMEHAREQKTNCKIFGQHSTCSCYPALLYFCHGHQVISPYLQVGSMCAKNGDQVGKWPCEELWQQARAPRQHLPAQHRSHLKGWKQKTALKGGCWVAHDLPLLIMPEDLDNSGDSAVREERPAGQFQQGSGFVLSVDPLSSEDSSSLGLRTLQLEPCRASNSGRGLGATGASSGHCTWLRLLSTAQP